MKVSPKKVKVAAKAAKIGLIAAMALAAQAGIIAQPFGDSLGEPVPV
jgi:hypothetical protein